MSTTVVEGKFPGIRRRTLEEVAAEAAKTRDARLSSLAQQLERTVASMEEDHQARVAKYKRHIAACREVVWRDFEAIQDAHANFLEGSRKGLMAASVGLDRALLDRAFGNSFAGRIERAIEADKRAAVTA